MRRGIDRFILLVVLGTSRTAGADTPPGVWDIAHDPLRRDSWAVHVRVERLLHPAVPDDALPLDPRRDEELHLEAARSILEQADAAHSRDVRLRFDLAAVYEQMGNVLGRADLHQRVVDLLVPAIDAAPNHPAATGALEALVYAYAKLDRPNEELATWRRYVPRLADERSRAAPLMNMGEAEMRLGRLDDAMGTFRRALRLCEELPNSIALNATYALTLWDLAVALDRAGDPRTAMETAARAKGWRWSGPGPSGQLRSITGWDVIRDQREVFFVPDWEREWYLALGYAADAGAAMKGGDALLAAGVWAVAEEHWGKYIERAGGAEGRDRWLAIARVRQAGARGERRLAEQRARKARSTGGRAWIIE